MKVEHAAVMRVELTTTPAELVALSDCIAAIEELPEGLSIESAEKVHKLAAKLRKRR